MNTTDHPQLVPARTRSRAARGGGALLRAISPWLLVLAGCSTPIGVNRVGGREAFRQVTASALQNESPSYYSLHLLHRLGQTETFRTDPAKALQQVHAVACEEKQREMFFALSELSYFTAAHGGDRAHHLAAAVYAYFYLFGHGAAGVHEPFDPRFRLASDLYNRSLAEFLRSAEGEVTLGDGSHALPFGRLVVRASRPGFPWSAEEFNRFLPAGEFRVRGLSGRHRLAGLGVPLIAVRTRRPGEGMRAASHLGSNAKISATAFLRIEGIDDGLCGGELSGSLELYTPFQDADVEVAGQRVPLESDLTAPLAYGLEESLLWGFELGEFLRGGKLGGFDPGIYLVQPYLRGKIPVVFVHGTASSPARWAEMFNELQADSKLRDRFQPWFFIYSTGNPIIYSGHVLRDALKEIVQEFDPQGTDPALRHMVVVGHSQGGLLTKLATLDSGDRFWDTISTRKLDELDLAEDKKELLRRVFFFERVPSVERVVFVCTPHRGSFMAGGLIGRISARLISVPNQLLDLGRGLLETNEASLVKGLGREIPSSVMNMDPANRFIRFLANIPVPAEVKCHSIIAVDGKWPAKKGDDGVVAYESAHIEESLSELVVRSGHSCQSNPLVINEVRRILLLHLAEVQKTP